MYCLFPRLKKTSKMNKESVTPARQLLFVQHRSTSYHGINDLKYPPLNIKFLDRVGCDLVQTFPCTPSFCLWCCEDEDLLHNSPGAQGAEEEESRGIVVLRNGGKQSKS